VIDRIHAMSNGAPHSQRPVGSYRGRSLLRRYHGGRARLLELGAPLALLAFWSGIAAAARAYSAGYDWRYQTISVLLNPNHDPHGYRWAWAGLELCGLAGLAWTAAPSQSVAAAIDGPRVAATRMLRLGFACMCCSVLPDSILPLSKGHELLAILAFLGIYSGVILQNFVITDDHQRSAVRLRASIWALLLLLPVVVAAFTQIYLSLARPHIPWVTPAWRTRGIPLYLSFAVWQWISCVVFSICLLVRWLRSLAASRAALQSRRSAVPAVPGLGRLDADHSPLCAPSAEERPCGRAEFAELPSSVEPSEHRRNE
jgi:uncharacterized membrane protein